MTKKIAIIAVNPVNGSGLFQYLEAFYENGIPYNTFAAAPVCQIKTNSGVTLQLDDTVSNLKGHEAEYGAMVFACGDAMPKYGENADKQFNLDLLSVIKAFDAQGKIIAGHCAAAVLFDLAGVGKGRKVAAHPYVKPMLKGCAGVSEQTAIDGNFYTAQDENSIWIMLPALLKALKA